MHLRDGNALVGEWMEVLWLVGLGAAGVVLIVLGLRRDDSIGKVFLLAGAALSVLGFGAQFFGWNPLSL